jgi:hypothetical protein
MTRLFTIASLAAVCGLAAAPALAATTLQVSGTVTSVSDTAPTLSLDASVFNGVPFSATFTYDPNLVDSQASASLGTYGPLQSFTASVGNYTFTHLATVFGGINITNSATDTYSLFAVPTNIIGVLGGTLEDSQIRVNLVDPTGTAFSSDALVAPVLSAFSTQSFSITLIEDSNSDPVQQIVIQGTITSLEASTDAVPEPASLGLLAGGSGLLLRRRRPGCPAQ